MATSTTAKKPAADAAARHALSAPENSKSSQHTEVVPECDQGLLEEVQRLHAGIVGAARKSFEEGIRVGEILHHMKKVCGHGRWLAFVERNLPFADTTASNYMRLYRDREMLKSANVADLNLSAAYRQLARSNRKPTDASAPKALPYQSADGESEVEVVEPEETQHHAENSDGETGDAKAASRLSHAEDDAVKGATDEIGLSEEQELVISFVNGKKFDGWQEGVFPAVKLDRDLRKVEELASSAPEQVVLAEQRMLAICSSAINQICGNHPAPEELEAVENALTTIRNWVGTHPDHPKYQK